MMNRTQRRIKGANSRSAALPPDDPRQIAKINDAKRAAKTDLSNIVHINSKEQLEKVLAIQKAVSDRARIELASGSSSTVPEFVEFAARTLEKYARYPTLTEFTPNLVDGTKWGATFGVTALVGALVLDHARRMIGVRSDLRLEYLRFLDTLAEPGKGSINMDALARVFAVLSESYGIVWTNGDSLSLTVAGKRVYLHMLDAAKFVEEASEATQKFRNPEEPSIPLDA